MLTVQEIQAMSFEKAVFGGYDQKSVDDFVEELAGDYGTLQKENAALKSKMKDAPGIGFRTKDCAGNP